MRKLSRREAAEILDDMKIKIEIPKAAVTQWNRNAALDMAIELLNYSEIPNSWILCSERLPEDGGDYLVTISIDLGKGEFAREVYKAYFSKWTKKWLHFVQDEVIAWQPLPKPYRGR